MNTQRDTPEKEPSLDEAIEALQAVVAVQKAQIDALLVSLEGLLATLNHRPQTPQAEDLKPRGALLGNPLDQQFASLHQLMGRLTNRY